MSAIAAIYYLSGRPVGEGDVRQMLDALKHRGTDAEGVRIDRTIGLGHRMRWVTPESQHEKLPMTDPRSKSMITCDARLDNRDELIGQLNFGGRVPTERHHRLC